MRRAIRPHHHGTTYCCGIRRRPAGRPGIDAGAAGLVIVGIDAAAALGQRQRRPAGGRLRRRRDRPARPRGQRPRPPAQPGPAPPAPPRSKRSSSWSAAPSKTRRRAPARSASTLGRPPQGPAHLGYRLGGLRHDGGAGATAPADGWLNLPRLPGRFLFAWVAVAGCHGWPCLILQRAQVAKRGVPPATVVDASSHQNTSSRASSRVRQ